MNIFTAQEAGDPMQEVEEVYAMANKGLLGDRYGNSQGSWSHKKVNIGEVSLISFEAFRIAAERSGVLFHPEDARRNIIVSLHAEELNELLGRVFYVGDAVLKGTEPCTPCNRPGELAGKKHFKEAFSGRGGIRTKVLSGGYIRKNDPINTD